MSHTKGPWVVMNGGDIFSELGADSGDGCTADSCDGWHIASIGDAPTFVDGLETDLGTDVKRANASLISSAPDLLEELEDAIAQMDLAAECIENGRYDEALLHVSSHMRNKKDAIAKARGHQ